MLFRSRDGVDGFPGKEQVDNIIDLRASVGEPRPAKGVIRVSLVPEGAGRLKLSIADDGIGFSMDETGKSVGSRLIRTFGAQLGGVSSVRSESGRGTVVELVFPDPALKEQAAIEGAPEKAPVATGEYQS